MTERKGEIHYDPIEQEPAPDFVEREFVYQGTKIEPGKPKELKVKKGKKTVVLKQPRRREIGLVYIPATDTVLEIPRAASSRFTRATPQVADFPQVSPRNQSVQELNATQKTIQPRRSRGALTTHYQVDTTPTRANRITKSYYTRVETYWGPPTKDHPPVKKKLEKIKKSVRLNKY